MTTQETEAQTRIRRAKEALDYCRTAETEARKALTLATESAKRAKEKYETLFLAEEQAEATRRRNQYDHATK